MRGSVLLPESYKAVHMCSIRGREEAHNCTGPLFCPWFDSDKRCHLPLKDWHSPSPVDLPEERTVGPREPHHEVLEEGAAAKCELPLGQGAPYPGLISRSPLLRPPESLFAVAGRSGPRRSGFRFLQPPGKYHVPGVSIDANGQQQ